MTDYMWEECHKVASTEVEVQTKVKGKDKVDKVDMDNLNRQIDEFEARKSKLNYTLTKHFNDVGTKQPNNVVERTCLQRLLRQVPDVFDQNGKPGLSPPFTLVKDPLWPSFENFLYANLDFQMVLLYILWWFLIENYT